MRLLAPDSYWFVLLTSYVPWALPGYLVALVALLALRRSAVAPTRGWVTGAAGVALAGTVFHLGLLAPAYLGDHPDGPPDLTVVSLNLRLGHGDAEATVRLLRAEKAQVAVLEEVTPALAARLRDAGLLELLPNLVGTPGPGGKGTLVLSTYPLSQVVPLPLQHDSYRLRVAAPTPFWLVAVHLAQPIKDPSSWRGDWSLLNRVVPALDGPVVLAGDFNTTLDHGTMRTLLDRGFSDSARESNAGWQPTWPQWAGLLAIDHVITRGGYAAASTRTVDVPGTDHRALVARLSTLGGS